MEHAFIYAFAKILPHYPLCCTMSHSSLMPRTLASPHSHSQGTCRWLRQAGRAPDQRHWLTPVTWRNQDQPWTLWLTGSFWLAHHVHPHLLVLYLWRGPFSFFLWDGKNSQCHWEHLSPERAIPVGGEVSGPEVEKALSLFWNEEMPGTWRIK